MKLVKNTYFNLFLILSLVLSPVTASLASMNMSSLDQTISDSQSSFPCHDFGQAQNSAQSQKQITINIDHCHDCIDCHCLVHVGSQHCNGFSSSPAIATSFPLFFPIGRITHVISNQKIYISLITIPDTPPPIA